MKKKFKNYRSTIILLLGVIAGAVIGLIFKADAKVLSPLGDLFLNLLLIVIVPLIFLSISSSIAKMKQPKRLGKILISIIIVFIVTSLLAVLVGLVATKTFNLVDKSDNKVIMESLNKDIVSEKVELNILERTVSAISVNDFSKLLSRDNLIALIVISILFGIAVNMAKEKGKKTAELLDSLNEVTMKLIEIIMYYAPIGLCCYFASLIGTIGSSIAIGYLKTFLIYLGTSAVFFFGIYTLLAFIAAGKKGIKAFWKNIIPASVTALGTCSSAASLPSNIECTKKIGVSNDIAETTISLGTSFHKDGSNIGSVFKIMFLVCLFGSNVTILEILGVALIATLLVTAVPIGGGTISEMLIITMLGFPIGVLPMLTIIATIIDAPATLLNVVGDSSSAMLVNRMVDGTKWIDR